MSQSASDNSVGIKETLTSLIIAFMLAFLFRGFVIEGFQIPTGSMAPTLLGKHIRFTSPYNGYDWSVGPWNYTGTNGRGNPLGTQSGLEVNDPMSALEISDTNRRLAAGDRVFVLKYLPILHQPERWDVVVFKNPGTHENYIKRLVGMPGEQIAFVDGDVFTRATDQSTLDLGWSSWTDSDWSIERKPERVQRTMFQDVFNSRYVPTGELGYRSPFNGATSGWEGILTESTYQFAGEGSTSLDWNGTRDITDFNAYNQTHANIDPFEKSDSNARLRPFPVSDIAIKLNIKSESSPVMVSPVLEARGMEFRGVVESVSGIATLEMRTDQTEPWVELDSGSFSAFGDNEMHSVEFWHVDQALSLFVDGELVCGGNERGAYELSPAARAAAATGQTWEALEIASQAREGDGEEDGHTDGVKTVGVFAQPELYRKPTFRWDFAGGAFTLSNVSVQRDIAYQVNRGRPTRGAHPWNFPTINNDEYFMCGDNSSNSLDSRLWEPGSIDPWVEMQIDDRLGMVNKDLVVGKAFVVYFPALLDDGPTLAPDFGRLRWIW